MDNRNGKDLFKAASVKSVVTAKFDAWEKEVREKAKKAIPEKESSDRASMQQSLDDAIQDMQEKIKKQTAKDTLSEGVLSHSKVWLPVCVNYGKQEYTKREYLDLMLYVVEQYGKEKVEMSLFPNRYLRKEEGKGLRSEAESIAISIQTWNQEEPTDVVMGEDGQIHISNPKYEILKGRIFDSTRCFPEGYEENLAALNAPCNVVNRAFKKDAETELKRDLKSATDKFLLNEDQETNERLSSEHIKRETAFVISQAQKRSPILFDGNRVILPDFEVCLILYPHDLFKLMEYSMKKAYFFDRYSYSIGAVKFKRTVGQELTVEVKAQLPEPQKVQLPESQNAQLLESQVGPALMNKKSKSNPSLTSSTLSPEMTDQKNNQYLDAAAGGEVFSDLGDEFNIVERPRGKSAPVASVSSASTDKKKNLLRQSSESSSDSSASSTSNSSSSAPSSLAGTPKVSPPLPGKFSVADNVVTAISSSQAMPISKNEGKKGGRKEIKGSSKPGFFVAPRQEASNNLRGSNPSDAHLKALSNDTSEEDSSSPSSSPSGSADSIAHLGRQGSGKTHLQMESDAQGLSTPPKTPSPRKKSPAASNNISVTTYRTASQTKAVMTPQGQLAVSSTSQTHFNTTQQVATTNSVDQGAVDKKNQSQQAYQRAVTSLSGLFGQGMGGLIKEVVAGGLVNEKGSPAEQLTLGVASVFSDKIVAAAVNQINQGLQINPGLN